MLRAMSLLFAISAFVVWTAEATASERRYPGEGGKGRRDSSPGAKSISPERQHRIQTYLQKRMNTANFRKLKQLSPEVMASVYEGAKLMGPKTIFINTGSQADIGYVRQAALKRGEEVRLSQDGHTYHFDGPKDQGRDTANTKYLAHEDTPISSLQKKAPHGAGTREVKSLMQDIMTGNEMIVSFISRGPIGAEVSDPTLQVTDSFYVTHSEHLLYRMMTPEAFSKDVADKGYMFVNLHSAGELTSNNVSANLSGRRIFMDVEGLQSFSCNNQYAGNSLAPKKINHRFANKRNLDKHFGQRLDEHMFITGLDDGGGEVTYFAGAYPSGCGKTGTAQTGSHLVGDDLAKLFIKGGKVRAVNPERGMFGIIDGVNRKDDPDTMDVLEGNGAEVIFSNLLVADGKPHWNDMGSPLPSQGINHEGAWRAKDKKPASHKNARFTLRLDALGNYDPKTESPDGVKLSALLYGGRDYATMPTVVMAHDWMNTVVHGAIVRSATTATEIGADGSEKRSPFANEAFFPGPLGKYIGHYKAFGENPAISPNELPSGFQVNYWLHKSARRKLAPGEQDGLIGEKQDTKVWMRAMGMMHKKQADSIWTPIGRIPKYEDLKTLFSKEIGKDYKKADYDMQFSLHIENLITRINRSTEEFSSEQGMPPEFFEVLGTWKNDLVALRDAHGPVVSPDTMSHYAADNGL